MNKEEIKETIEHFKDGNVSVRVRDIAYVLLSKMFDEPITAYQCLFGTIDGYDEYSSQEMLRGVESYMVSAGFIRNVHTDTDTNTLTFDENKNELIAMIPKIEADMESGVIEKKDGYARLVDIRTKLNDKFKVEKEKLNQQIVVEKKFDFICPHTRRECYQLDKEEAMKKFNLIEKTS